MYQLATIILGILIGVAVELITKNTTVAVIAILACLAVATGIEAIKRLRSLNAWTSSSTAVRASSLALLGLMVALFMITSAAAAYSVKRAGPSRAKPQPFSLTFNPEVDLVARDKTVSAFKVKGTVSGLGPGETIWVANVPKKEAEASNIDEENLAKAKVYPAFGPCIISGNEWKCDKVYMTHSKEDHYVLAYRVPSAAARELVQYQSDAYSGQPNCQKGVGSFPPIAMPRDAQLADHVVKFA